MNDPFDPTASLQGTSWIYIYDQGGNILSKIAYAFTEEETISGSAIHTDTYTYGNAHWKDQMTAYNSIPITYDAIGNPIADGEWTYVWHHGRQLAQMNKGEETICFIYNQDGLRIQKTATSTGTTKYILHGKDIVHLTNGQDELHFFYDAQGRIAVVEYNGTPYIYIHNLQGDVIALTDGNGNTVVEYNYDSWGKPVRKAGTMAATLGTIQPFRYRGYIWDEETGLYYLRSRYYNPKCGRFINIDKPVQSLLFKGANAYEYCLNNPTLFIDCYGYDVTINIYNTDFSTILDVDLGHVDISIDGTIFTYGRYRDTWGLMGMYGSGILIVGNEDYFIKQQKEKEKRIAARFTLSLSSEEEERIKQFYTALIHSGMEEEVCDGGSENERHVYSFPAGHKYHEYNITLKNCTTLVVDALKWSLGNRFPLVLNGVFVPSELFNILNNSRSIVLRKDIQ